MTPPSFALFDTPIGRCAIVWGVRGVIGVELPAASEAATRARLLRRHPQAREAAPPTEIARAIAGVGPLLRKPRGSR